MLSGPEADGLISCELCQRVFKTPQGLSGHLHFRHGERELDALWTRSREKKWFYLQGLVSRRDVPSLVAAEVSYLLAKELAHVGSADKSICPRCGHRCKTPQGLSGHVRFRHLPSSQARIVSSRFQEVGRLVDFLDGYSLPEEVQVALWERICRLLGFPA